MICIVCNDEIVEGQLFFHHQRLNVDLHASCPTTDAMGEDVSMHTMMCGTA